jgi:hypothetical protein
VPVGQQDGDPVLEVERGLNEIVARDRRPS